MFEAFVVLLLPILIILGGIALRLVKWFVIALLIMTLVVVCVAIF